MIGHGESQIPEIHVRVSSQAARRFVLSASNGASPLEFARLNSLPCEISASGQPAHGRPRVLNAVDCRTQEKGAQKDPSRTPDEECQRLSLA